MAGLKLATAKTKIRRNHCSVGRITRKHSHVRAGRVIAQSPRAHARLAQKAPVGLVVSTGRR